MASFPILDIIDPMVQGKVTSIEPAIKLLKQLPLFADLADEDLVFLVQNTRFQQVEREQVLFYQGDSADRIWLVYKGQVKIIYHDENGREVILEIISSDEAFGGGVLFFPQHPATAITMEDSTIASFSSDLYASFLLDHPTVVLKLLRMLGTRHLSMINMQTLVGERARAAHGTHPGQAGCPGRKGRPGWGFDYHSSLSPGPGGHGLHHPGDCHPYDFAL